MFSRNKSYTDSVIINEKQVSIADLKKKAKWANVRFWSVGVSAALIGSMVLPYMSIAATIATSDSQVFNGEVIPGYSMGGIKLSAYGVQPNSWARVSDTSVVGSSFGVWSGDRLAAARKNIDTDEVVRTDEDSGEALNLSSEDRSKGWGQITGRSSYSLAKPDGYDADSARNTSTDNVAPVRTVQDYNFWRGMGPNSGGNGSANINVSLYPDFIVVNCDKSGRAKMLTSPDEISVDSDEILASDNPPQSVPFYVPLSALFDAAQLRGADATLDKLTDFFGGDDGAKKLGAVASANNLLESADNDKVWYHDVNGSTGGQSTAFNPYPYSMVFSTTTENGTVVSSIYNNAESYVYFSPSSMYNQYIALKNEYQSLLNQMTEGQREQGRNIFQIGYYLAGMSILEAYLDEALPQDMTLGYVGPSETSPSVYTEAPGCGQSDYAPGSTSVSYASLMYDVAICTSGEAGQSWHQYETNAVMQTLSTFGYEQISDKYRTPTRGTGVMMGLNSNGVYSRMTLFNPYWRSNADEGNKTADGQDAAGLYIPVYYPIQQHKLPDSEKVYRFQILSAIPYSTLLKYIKLRGFAENVALTYTDAGAPIEDFSTISTAKNSVAALAAQYNAAAEKDSNDDYLLSQLNKGGILNEDTKKMEIFSTAAKDPESIGSEDHLELTKYRVESSLLGYESGSMNSDNVHDLFDVIRATKDMKLETWYRFYNPIKSEGGDNDLFLTRVSPAATTYMPAMLLQGYTPAGGTNKNTDGKNEDGKYEVANAFSPQNCAFDYFSIPSFAPCFAAHTAMETYYGILNYELRPFYSEGLIRTLSKSANVPALPALEEFEKQREEAQKQASEETDTLDKNIAAVYVMAKRVAYLNVCVNIWNTVFKKQDKTDVGNGTHDYGLEAWNDPGLYESADGGNKWDGTYIAYNDAWNNAGDMWKISVDTSVNDTWVDKDNNVDATGTFFDWTFDTFGGGTYPGYPFIASANDTAGTLKGDKPIPFKGRGKGGGVGIFLVPTSSEDATAENWSITVSSINTNGFYTGENKQNTYTKDDWPNNNISFEQMLENIDAGNGKYDIWNEDTSGGVATGTRYTKTEETIDQGVWMHPDMLVSIAYEKELDKLLGKNQGEYYWESMDTIKEWMQKDHVKPETEADGPDYHEKEAEKHSVRIQQEWVSSVVSDGDKTYGAVLRAYTEQLDLASGEIGKAIVNIAKDYQLILDSMPTKMQNCLAWADYQTPSDSENQYQSDPSDANVTVNVAMDAGDSGEKDYSNVKSVNDLGQYGLTYDAASKKIKTAEEKVNEDTSSEGRMVRGVEGTTWFATNQPAEYTMSATIARINDLASNTSITFPYSGLYRGRLQSGTDRYATLQAHVIDYTSIASGIAGDLSTRQRSQVVSLVEPQYTSITDFLDIVGLIGALFKEIGSAIIKIPAEAFSALMFGEGVNNTTVADKTDTGASKSDAAMTTFITANGQRMNRLPASYSSFNPSTGEMEYGTIAPSASSGYTTVASNANAATMDRTSMVTSMSGFILTGLQPLYASLQALGLVLVMVFLGFIAFKNFFAYAIASNSRMLEAQTQLKVVIPRAIIAIFMIGLPPIGAGVGFEGGNFLVLRLISELMAQVGGIFLGLNSGGVMDIFTNVDLVASFGADIGAYIIYLLACVVLAICFILGCIVLVVQALVLFFFYFFGPIVWALYIWPYNANSGSVTKAQEGESGNAQLARRTGNILPMVTNKMSLGFFSGGRVGNLAPMGHIYNYTVIAGLTCVWAVMFWFVAMIFSSVAGLQTSSSASSANAAILASGYPSAASAAHAEDIFGTLFGAVPPFVRILLATILAVLCFVLMAWLLFNELKKQFENQKGILGAIGSAVAKGAQAGGGLLGRAADAKDRKDQMLADAGINSTKDISRKKMNDVKARQQRLEAALAGNTLSDKARAKTQKNLEKNKEKLKQLEDARKKYKDAQKQARKDKLLNTKPAQKARLASAGAKALLDKSSMGDSNGMRAFGNTLATAGKAMQNGQLMNALGNAAAAIENKNLDRQLLDAKRGHHSTQKALDAYKKLTDLNTTPDERERILAGLSDDEQALLQTIGAGQNVNGKFVFNDKLLDEGGTAARREGLKQLADKSKEQFDQAKALEDKKAQNEEMYKKILTLSADEQKRMSKQSRAEYAAGQAAANMLGDLTDQQLRQAELNDIKQQFHLEDKEGASADEQAAKILSDLDSYRKNEIRESNINSLMQANDFSRDQAVKALDAMDQNMVNVATAAVLRPLAKRMATLARGVDAVVDACRPEDGHRLSPEEARKAAQSVCSGYPPCTKDEYIEITNKLERGEDLTLRQTEAYRAFQAACKLANMPLPDPTPQNLPETAREMYQSNRDNLMAINDTPAAQLGVSHVSRNADGVIQFDPALASMGSMDQVNVDMNEISAGIEQQLRAAIDFSGSLSEQQQELTKHITEQITTKMMEQVGLTAQASVGDFMSGLQLVSESENFDELFESLDLDLGDGTELFDDAEKNELLQNSLLAAGAALAGTAEKKYLKDRMTSIDKELLVHDEIKTERLATSGSGAYMMDTVSKALPENLMDVVHQALPTVFTGADFVNIANGPKPDKVDDDGWAMIIRTINRNIDGAVTCESAKSQTTVLNSKYAMEVAAFDQDPSRYISDEHLRVIADITDDPAYISITGEHGATVAKICEYNSDINNADSKINMNSLDLQKVETYATYVQDGLAPALFSKKMDKKAEACGADKFLEISELRKKFVTMTDEQKNLLISGENDSEIIAMLQVPALEDQSDMSEKDYVTFLKDAYSEYEALQVAEKLHADEDYAFGMDVQEKAARAKARQKDLVADKLAMRNKHSNKARSSASHGATLPPDQRATRRTKRLQAQPNK